MKTQWIVAPACLLISLSCAHQPRANLDSSARPTQEVNSGYESPTPNTQYDAAAMDRIPDQDPEGDLAPMVACRAGEVTRRQSGKIICVDPKMEPSSSTISGR